MFSTKTTSTNPNWLKDKLKQYKEVQDVLAVGFPKGTDGASTRYPDGTQVAFVATVNNFGSKSRNIPKRPFMSLSKKPALEKVLPIQNRLLPKFNEGKITAAQILETCGPFAVSEFQKTITDLKTPPNSDETIARKKSSNPLIDTGLMRQTVTYVVRKP